MSLPKPQNPKTSLLKTFHPQNLTPYHLKTSPLMTPLVSIIMGSTSDLPVMEKAAKFLNDMEIPFEMNALSAHRTPQ